jgi:catechol 2,3-dioxygenase-like lactoylglutathione lyase family enzyme
MTINNVLASVAVRDLETACAWYTKLIGSPPTRPMPEVAEWHFPQGGGLQVYQLAERAGHGSLTFTVTNLEPHAQKLAQMGVDTGKRASNSRVKTLMVVDPDGNHIAFAEAHDPTLLR